MRGANLLRSCPGVCCHACLSERIRRALDRSSRTNGFHLSAADRKIFRSDFETSNCGKKRIGVHATKSKHPGEATTRGSASKSQLAKRARTSKAQGGTLKTERKNHHYFPHFICLSLVQQLALFVIVRSFVLSSRGRIKGRAGAS
jgi:hypothetical protein